MNIFKKARLKAGMKVKTVAKEMGISINQIYKWERGEVIPHKDNIKRLAEIYGVTTKSLLANNNEVLNDKRKSVLKEAREMLGLSQTDIAKRLGVTKQAVCLWEHKVQAPREKTLKKLKKIFGSEIVKKFLEETAFVNSIKEKINIKNEKLKLISDAELRNGKHEQETIYLFDTNYDYDKDHDYFVAHIKAKRLDLETQKYKTTYIESKSSIKDFDNFRKHIRMDLLEMVAEEEGYMFFDEETENEEDWLREADDEE